MVSFFLERVSFMRLQVPLNRMDAEDPRMLRWAEAMAQHGGGGGPTVTYGAVFFVGYKANY